MAIDNDKCMWEHNMSYIIYTSVKIGYVSIRSKTLSKHYIHNHRTSDYHLYDRITTCT